MKASVRDGGTAGGVGHPAVTGSGPYMSEPVRSQHDYIRAYWSGRWLFPETNPAMREEAPYGNRIDR